MCEAAMKGQIQIEVSNRDVKFKFTLNRNITVIRGESGTGKTTLFEMIAEYTRLGNKSGVNVKCEKNVAAPIYADWQNQLGNYTESIIFIDEGFDWIRSESFARFAKNTDNYYVLFTREPLHELPYSVEEIYEIKTSGKFHSLRNIYKPDKKHFIKADSRKKGRPDIFLTEDSASGFEFFRNYFKDTIKCERSSGNASIFKYLKTNEGKNILILADGAAFGSEIDRILKMSDKVNFRLCLPESFEWLILKSGLIPGANLKNLLDSPSEYIESSKYFSWEHFFADYQIDVTKDTEYKYQKSKLNKFYLSERNSKRIVAEIFDND